MTTITTNVKTNRGTQIVAWIVAGVFVLGNFFSLLGAWTSPVMGVWFVGTQKPRRGFLWMIAFAFVPSLFFGWRKIPLTGPAPAFAYLGWMFLTAVFAVLPFTFHRLVSPRLPGFLSTLPLPLAAVAIPALALALHIGAASEAGLQTFLLCWLAAILLWLWNRESRATIYAFSAGLALAFDVRFLPAIEFSYYDSSLFFSLIFGCACLSGVLLLTIWALFHPLQHNSWAARPQTVTLLHSPFSGQPLHLVREQGREAMVSISGERFPVRDGIPIFLKQEELTGDNLKYNHLYETIGGFYDDIQRVFCALKGFDRDDYFLSYMRLLEVKPGDSVLETSVGTGLNFKYLPSGVKLSGLDLSPEMLTNCQANLRHWKMDADLYLCNAESLPFADSSFDVVFHVGGINFFNDRAQAIREMIRVAKPGSCLLIADETEEHVKSVYEKQPGGLYKNRKAPVAAPIDLVPPEMQEVHLELLKNGMFYALTFRKPPAVS